MLRARSNKSIEMGMANLITGETWVHALGIMAGHSGAKTVADLSFIKDIGMINLRKNGVLVRRLPDASDLDAIEETFLKYEGPLCIVVSGLLIYLTDTDTGIFFDAMHSILSEKGGCLLTPDPESERFFMSAWQAVCAERFIDVMMRSDESRPWRDKLQIDNTMVIDPRWDYDRLCEKAKSFLAAHGLGAELLPADRHVPDFSEEIDNFALSRDELKSAFKTLSYWKITPICDGAGIEKRLTGKANSFSPRLRGQTLILKLAGRVDSQSAPALSGLYDVYKDVCSKVEIDCRELKYISSMGLRVLTSMAKRCAVSMYGVKEAVGEILSQTGLDTFLDISSDKKDT